MYRKLLKRSKLHGIFAAVALGVALLSVGCISDAAFSDPADAGLLKSLAGALENVAIDDDGGQRPDDVSDDRGTATDDSSQSDDVFAASGGFSALDDSATSSSALYDDGAAGTTSSPGATALTADVYLKADLGGAGPESGWAVYHATAGRRTFTLEVENFAPSTYAVMINGTEIARIKVDTFGTGGVKFDSKQGRTPLPDEFPAQVRRGDTVSIEDVVKGVFQ